MPISESTTVVRNSSLPTGEIDGELVALDLERGECFGIDEVGAVIWGLAEKPISVGEIADRLIELHDVDRSRCLADISPFIEDLLASGLLKRAS
jgi:hypothetical protein